MYVPVKDGYPAVKGYARGSIVFTRDRGPVPIEEVRDWDLVWDGEAWVSHDGVVCMGTRRCIEWEGLLATPMSCCWPVPPEGEDDWLPVCMYLLERHGLKVRQAVPEGYEMPEEMHLDDLVYVATRAAGRPVLLRPVYELRNCGPKHRFSCQGLLVHNLTDSCERHDCFAWDEEVGCGALTVGYEDDYECPFYQGRGDIERRRIDCLDAAGDAAKRYERSNKAGWLLDVSDDFLTRNALTARYVQDCRSYATRLRAHDWRAVAPAKRLLERGRPGARA